MKHVSCGSSEHFKDRPKLDTVSLILINKKKQNCKSCRWTLDQAAVSVACAASSTKPAARRSHSRERSRERDSPLERFLEFFLRSFWKPSRERERESSKRVTRARDPFTGFSPQKNTLNKSLTRERHTKSHTTPFLNPTRESYNRALDKRTPGRSLG